MAPVSKLDATPEAAESIKAESAEPGRAVSGSSREGLWVVG